MSVDPTEVARLDANQDYEYAVPTPDHFIPLLYLAGLAGAQDTGTDVLVDGYTYGSLSMTSYTLGLDASAPTQGTGTPELPLGVPAESSNI